jgi:sulfite reductase (NADPH) flavoprotein alpha-component
VTGGVGPTWTVRLRRAPFMSLLREAWVQVHWFIGITAGSVLVVVGLSGAVLSFRAEIVEALNPGLSHIAAPTPGAVPLAPADLVERLRAGSPQRRIATLTVLADAGRPARVNFAPPPGERRGETRAVDPYTGALLPHPRGDGFFEFVERLHRWLLLPREDGKPVTGTLAAGLLVLALSGLYLRWPRRPLSWRAWLRIDVGLKGRAFLWSLHAVVGTVALPLYVVSAATGIYWGFDAVRARVDAAAGEGREVRMQRMGTAAATVTAPAVPAATAAPAGPAGPDLPRVWAAFQAATAGDWTQVTLRLPTRGAAQVEATYLRTDAAHDRARNRLYLEADSGAVTRHERYADKPLAGRLVNSIHPLHMGTYWGLPGRIAMALSSAALALFAITGWWMYLARRRTGAQVRRERARLAATVPGGGIGGAAPVLLAFASQTGHAERIALRTAAALQAAGVAVDVRPLAALDAALLRRQRHLLIVASTFGDGDPPDAAHGVVERLDREAGAAGLPHLRYGLLALGDVHYATFCGFGRTLRHHLQGLGAQPLFPMIEVDDGDPAALARWTREVGMAFGVDLDASAVDPAQAPHDEPAFESWRLARRTLLNPGSQGEALYEIELRRDGDAASGSAGAAGVPAAAASGPTAGVATWASGALAELRPPRAGDAPPAVPRRYSVASLPQDGCVQLLVRQVRHAGGLGLASGWLTEHAPLGATVELRLRPNPAFALVADERPCVFIGNGSGFGGLRGHLRERVRRGHHRNWLVHGERQAAHDDFLATELAGWQHAGAIERADRVFSRDTPVRRHVQDHLREAADTLRRWVDEGGVIYVCGSLAGMAPGVDRALRDVLGDARVDDLLAENRYRRDVY